MQTILSFAASHLAATICALDAERTTSTLAAAEGAMVDYIHISDAAVGRAMVVLLSRQTAGEQHTGCTVESNGRGFTAFNANNGTYYAKYVMGLSYYAAAHEVDVAIVRFLSSNAPGRLLSNQGGKRNFLDKARKIALTHRMQLVEVALAKRIALRVVADVG
jgi:hypothetical protein